MTTSDKVVRDHVIVEEVGPGAFALRKEGRDVPPQNSREMPPWVQLTLPLPELDSPVREPGFVDEEPTTEWDPIVQPQHYAASAVETIDAIEAWGLNYRLGNVVKYVSRAGKKDPSKRTEDLLKARWYLDREIARSGQ